MLAEEAHLALVDTLVQCSVRSLPGQPAKAVEFGLAACRRLSVEHSGILSWPPKHHNGRCLFALRRVSAMLAAAEAATTSHPGVLAALTPLLDELAALCDDCMANISEAERKAGQKLTGWQVRVALAAALAALLRLGSQMLQGELLDAAGTFIQGLLGDDAYAARLAGNRLVQVGWGMAESGWGAAARAQSVVLFGQEATALLELHELTIPRAPHPTVLTPPYTDCRCCWPSGPTRRGCLMP